MKPYKLLIWDYNGTIIDDVKCGIDSVNVLLRDRGLPLLESVEQYHRLFGFPIRDYYARLGFDFSKEPYEDVAHLWVAEYLKREPEIQLCPHVKEVLQAVKDEGISQIIFSSCERKMLENELESYGINGYFDRIYAGDSIYAYGKTEMARRVYTELPSPGLMIGDTVHDYQTSQILHADCVLYSKGHESEESLKAYGVPIIDNLLKLLPMMGIS